MLFLSAPETICKVAQRESGVSSAYVAGCAWPQKPLKCLRENGYCMGSLTKWWVQSRPCTGLYTPMPGNMNTHRLIKKMPSSNYQGLTNYTDHMFSSATRRKCSRSAFNRALALQRPCHWTMHERETETVKGGFYVWVLIKSIWISTFHLAPTFSAVKVSSSSSSTQLVWTSAVSTRQQSSKQAS